MGGQQSTPGPEGNFVFVVPSHLNLSPEQVNIMVTNGQQPGVPFAISNGTTVSPDRRTILINYSSSLISLQKATVKAIPSLMDSKTYSLSFNYDASVQSDLVIRFGVTDITDDSKISFSMVEMTWGPFTLEPGLNVNWDSKLVDKFLSENNLPSRRRKITHSNSYDIAICLTPRAALTGSGKYAAAAAATNKSNQSSPKKPFFFSLPMIRSQPEQSRPSNSTDNPSIIPPTTIESDLMPDSNAEDALEQHLRQIQENQERLIHTRARQATLQQQFHQQSQQIQQIQSQSNSPPPSVPSSPKPSASASRPQNALPEATNEIQNPETTADTTNDINENIFDAISSGFWNFSKQIVAFTAIPLTDAISEPIERDKANETSENNNVTTQENITTENLDFQYAMTGGRNTYTRTLYSNPNIYVYGDDDLPMSGAPIEPRTRLSSASFGVEPNAAAAILRPLATIPSPAEPPGPIAIPNSPHDVEFNNTKIYADKTEKGSIEKVNSMITRSNKKFNQGKHITTEVSFIRASSSKTGSVLVLTCFSQRVQMASSVYYVNKIFGLETDTTSNPADNAQPTAAAEDILKEKASEGAPAVVEAGQVILPTDTSKPIISDAPASEANKDDNADDECVICLSEKRTVALYPCRHTCLCLSCATSLAANGNKCPICRHSVVLLLNLKPTPAAATDSKPTFSTVNFSNSNFVPVDGRNTLNNSMTTRNRPTNSSNRPNRRTRSGSNDRQVVRRVREIRSRSRNHASSRRGTRITITSRDLEGDSDEEIEMRGPIDYRTDDNNTRNGEFYQPPVDEMEESGPYDPYDIEDSDEDDEH